MARQYTFRLTAEGVRELEAQFKAAGSAGEKLFTDLQNKVPGLGGVLDTQNKKLDEHRKRLEDAAKGAETFTKGLAVAQNVLGAFGIALSVGAVVNFGKELFKTTAAIADTSKVLGVGIEALQAYRAAAVRTGEDIASVDTALRFFIRAIGEANESSGTQRKAFEALGLTARDLAGGTESSLPKVSRALLDIRDEGERARLMTVLFSRSGQEVVTMLEDWSDPAIIRRMKDLGLVIDEDLVKRADEADARWQVFWMQFKVGAVNAVDFLQQKMKELESNPIVGFGMSLGRGENPFAGGGALAGTNIKMGLGGPYAPLVDSVAVTPRAPGPWVDEAALKAQSTAREAAIREQEQSQARFEQNYRESMSRLSASLNEKIARDLKAEQDWRSKQYLLGRAQADAYEKFLQEQLDAALKYGEELLAAERERVDKSIEQQTDGIERSRDKIKAYWEGVAGDLDFAAKDFWMDFAETGELSFDRLFQNLKRTFASTLYDMIIEAQLRPIILNIVGSIGGVGGAVGAAGSAAGGVGGVGGLLGVGGIKLPTWAGAGILGAGVGSITGMIGGNSTGGAVGGALGGVLGNFLLPGVGGLIGGALGGLAGGLVGGKPSDMRSVATFGANGAFNVAAQSAHESSQETLMAASQAAAAISQEIQALTSMGVQFTQQLANVWIGARDASSYQLVGGQRVSAGSVGDPADLARDALAALLGGATSDDPMVAGILAKGGSIEEIKTALTFARGITDALAQITDPMKYALEMWERTARANLAMAEQTGFSLEKVHEYNAKLYQQTVAQINAPAIAGLDQFINSFQYGAGSAASPKAQLSAAFSDYDAARQAALANPTAQTAAAFQQAAQAYAPLAREFYGSGGAYNAFVTSATQTAEQLKGFLAAPAMPDLSPVVTTIQTSANLTVDAQQQTTAAVKSLDAKMDRFGSVLEALMRRMTETV